MTAKEIIRILEANGWHQVKGSISGHRQYKHDRKPGKVTVPMHPGDVTLLVIKSIERQAGLKLRGEVK